MDQLIDEIVKVVIFENWLRFYFITEKNSDYSDDAVLEISEENLNKIAVERPEYLPLAVQMNNKQVRFETSRQAILNHILSRTEKFPADLVMEALEGSEFQNKLSLFTNWLQMHATQLDQGLLGFGIWLELYDKWQKAQSKGAKACKNS